MTHQVYQTLLTAKLKSWQRRRARALPPAWLEAALVLWRLDLDAVREQLTPLYSPSPRGRKPYEPICMLRALLLMSLLQQTSLTQFAAALQRQPRLAVLAGFEPFDTPAVGTFYLFLERLEDGPWQPASPARVRPSVARRTASARHLKQEKAQHEEVRRRILAQADSLTSHLAAELRQRADEPRPPGLEQRLEDLLFVAAVLPSAGRGLLGDLQGLILSGDGSSLPTGASRSGRPSCDCRSKGIFHCDHPRFYSDASADWGFDSYHQCFYFGHTYYQHCVGSAGHDLPLHLTLGPASETDFTLSLTSLDRFRKTCAAHHFPLTIAAVAYDSGHDSLGIYRFLLDHHIAPVIVLNPRSGSAPTPSGTATAVNPDGIPLCPAQLPMRCHGPTPNGRLYFHCPVKRPTHLNGQSAWNVFPDQCPRGALCQPDSKMGPVVYIRTQHDPRLYPPIPRHSPRFRHIMRQRTACERSNSFKKVASGLGRRPCRSRPQFLIRLTLISIIEHAKAWLAQDRSRGQPNDWRHLMVQPPAAST